MACRAQLDGHFVLEATYGLSEDFAALKKRPLCFGLTITKAVQYLVAFKKQPYLKGTSTFSKQTTLTHLQHAILPLKW